MIKQLKRYKKQNRIGYYNMALDCGVSYYTLYRYMNGAKNLEPESLRKIKKYAERIM